MNSHYLLALPISIFISYFATPLVIKFFHSHHWIEDPKIKQRKSGNATATKAVPRGGGLPIFISVFITSLIFLPLDKHLLGIILASFFALIIGLIDDIKDISPIFRLFTNIFCALIVVAAGIGIAYVSNPLGGVFDLSYPRIYFSFLGDHSIWLLADLLAVFWIVWCMNFVGFHLGYIYWNIGFKISKRYYSMAGYYFSLYCRRCLSGFFTPQFFSSKNNAGLQWEIFSRATTGRFVHSLGSQISHGNISSGATYA
jgi:hypothetical protein